MFIVEYLVIVENLNCNEVKSLKNLIQADDNFAIIDSNIIKYGDFSFCYDFIKGEISDENKTYFHLKLHIKEEKHIENFTKALKALKRILALVNRNQFLLWDDIAKYYAEKAYSKIFHIENLMRKLLSKFMFINLGIGWTDKRIPLDVKNSVKQKNKEINFLHNLNFKQLSNFLFSENYPVHKENLIKKLKQASDLSSLNLQEIKSLMPESNWERYFSSLVNCEADYLKKRWEKIYDLRNKIAHNKTFNKGDLEEVEKLIGEVQKPLDEAIEKLEEVIIPENEVENIVEEVVAVNNELLKTFFATWRDFETIIEDLCEQLTSENIIIKQLSEQLTILQKKGFISERISNELIEIRKYRNLIAHGINTKITNDVINNYIHKLKKIIYNIAYTEREHIANVKNKEIIDLYSKLKTRILENFSNINLKSNKHWISFISNSNIVDVQIQQKALKIWINMPKGKLNDKYNLTRDVSDIGHYGNGDYEIQIKSDENLDKIMDLIKQSYENSLK